MEIHGNSACVSTKEGQGWLRLKFLVPLTKDPAEKTFLEQWLFDLGLPQYLDFFVKQDLMTRKALSLLTKEDIETLGNLTYFP